jgi:arylsulfatase
MATCVDLSGANYPTKFNGERITPMEGVSLRPALQGKSLQRAQPIFWEHEGNRAVREDRWKLVSKFPGGWELYDMISDRTEMHDLAQKQPERVLEMAAQWEAWASRVGVAQWPLGGGDKKKNQGKKNAQ